VRFVSWYQSLFYMSTVIQKFRLFSFSASASQVFHIKLYLILGNFPPNILITMLNNNSKLALHIYVYLYGLFKTHVLLCETLVAY